MQNGIHIIWSKIKCSKCPDMNRRIGTFAHCINSVIDDALLKTMPDIDEALLQFINVMSQEGSDLCC